MQIHFSWTRFKFETPQEIALELFTSAREQPDQLVRSGRAQVRATARSAILPIALPAVAAAMCTGLAALFDFTSAHSWQTIIGNSLLFAGIAMALAAVFTIGSFLRYVAAANAYWRALAKTALDHASYSDFLNAWTRRQQVGIAGDREVPWWLSLLVLAGVLLAAYFSLYWFTQK